MFHIEYQNNNAYIKNVSNFDLAQTLDCGQAFRWSPLENGRWCGTAYGRYLELEKCGEDIVLYNTSKEDFEGIWRGYFDLSRDYAQVISSVESNEILLKASSFGSGIRILSQEPWEALCSFIISQNNNIPRIKGIIERLCEGFGEKCGSAYSFPEASRLAVLDAEDLAPLRAGFRAKYIIDAARKVASGEVKLEQLRNMDIDAARDELMKIKGVGPKVADCTLLFGLGHIEAFPKDVWIKRAMQELFGGELPQCAEPFAGIIQQYIFYYMREKIDK